MSRVSRTDYSGKGFNQLQKVLDDLYTRNIKSQTRIAYDSDRINYLEKQIQGIQDDIKGIKGDLDGHGRSLSKIEYQVREGLKGLNMDLGGMARMHNALKSRVETLENKK